MKRKLSATESVCTAIEDGLPSSKRIKLSARALPSKTTATKTRFDDANPVFSDPLNKSTDAGLNLPMQESCINFEKWQPQQVEEVQVTGCVHKVCYPPGVDGRELHFSKDSVPKYTPAKVYKFELDIFQKESVDAIECGHNVLVAAHTSAGKTTVAEYAIAKSLKNHQRVIYTSPIKALSNQKYRALKEEFIDVGLMTGDVTINRDAGCLVMTTEILRNMLYRGAEIVREITWVIFDEIHYMKDPSRGVVWEETLILLPPQSRFVFLSATIPNSVEFAKWISKINTWPCHVIYTEMRPVPLQHYVFPSGGKGIHLVVDHKGNFKEANFQKALNSMKIASMTRSDGSGGAIAAGIGTSGSGALTGGRKRGGKKGISLSEQRNEDLFKLVKMIVEREFDPCIVFAFSKRDVEQLGYALKKMDLTTSEEKKEVIRVYKNALATLSAADQRIPQLVNVVQLLQRGIGIHHAGLLPIVKEIVEILFGEGLIKVLFATETFAMGVNFPAKTVIFSSVQKWDGERRRLLTSGEYVQMSGRSGRRGLDTRGIVIMLLNDKLEPSSVQLMLKGKSDRLVSQFHLKYNMIIQLLRVGDHGSDDATKKKKLQKKKMEEDFLALERSSDLPMLEVGEIQEEKEERSGVRKAATRGILPKDVTMDATYLIKRSFMHFQRLERTPQLIKEIAKLKQNRADLIRNIVALQTSGVSAVSRKMAAATTTTAMATATVGSSVSDELYYSAERCEEVMECVSQFVAMRSALSELSAQYRGIQNDPKHLLPWLNPGRLLHIVQHSIARDWGWGVLISFRRLSEAEIARNKELRTKQRMLANDGSADFSADAAKKFDDEDKNGASNFVADVLLPCFKLKNSSGAADVGSDAKLGGGGGDGESQKKGLIPVFEKLPNSDELRADYNKDPLNTLTRFMESTPEFKAKVRKLQKKRGFSATASTSVDPLADLTFRLIPVQLKHVNCLSQVRVNLVPSLHTSSARRKLGHRLMETQKKCMAQFGAVLRLDPVKDMKIDAAKSGIETLAAKISVLRQRIETHELSTKHSAETRRLIVEGYESVSELSTRLASTKHELAALESNEHIRTQLKCMNRVLRRLGLVKASKEAVDGGGGADAVAELAAASSVVTLKGNVACEMSCADELVSTELIFSNYFLEALASDSRVTDVAPRRGMSAARVVALLSCLVFEAKGNDKDQMPPMASTQLKDDYANLRDKIKLIASICRDSSLRINLRKYLQSFSPSLMEVCLAWSQGAAFVEIAKMTKEYEGSVVRVIRRLFELLDEMIHAASIVGNDSLKDLFQDAQNSIKRDIIFSASLYL